MLVIARNKSESIEITVPGHDKIKIYYKGENSWGQGVLGIEAPPEIKIYRQELADRIAEEAKLSGFTKD